MGSKQSEAATGRAAQYQQIPNSRSVVSGISWPAMPGPAATELLAILYQLEQSQWWSPEALLEQQLRQLQPLLMHACQTVPFYRQRFDRIGFKPAAALTPDIFARLPLLTRSEVQTAGDSLRSRQIPASHGSSHVTQTSGSTGQPVKVHSTDLTALFWRAFTVRDHHWHNRDLSGKLAAIRAFREGIAEPPDGDDIPGWGPATDAIYQTGPSAMLRLGTDIGVQAAWLQRHNPDYLLTYPSNLMALVSHCKAAGTRLPKLREIRTVGETLGPEVRAACRETWGVPVVDVYSSQEMGYIALQCPQSEHYHLQCENALVEILDGQDQPCKAGEIGRLVVTGLHNFATPLIRYELGDYAEVGPPCQCGRGLPVITRILGRQRNMLMLPSGEMRWPLVGFKDYAQIAPIRQFQFVQKSPELIEMRLVTDRPLTATEEARLKELIQQSLGYPFQLTLIYQQAIPRHRNGKFEEFISEIDQQKAVG